MAKFFTQIKHTLSRLSLTFQVWWCQVRMCRVFLQLHWCPNSFWGEAWQNRLYATTTVTFKKKKGLLEKNVNPKTAKRLCENQWVSEWVVCLTDLLLLISNIICVCSLPLKTHPTHLKTVQELSPSIFLFNFMQECLIFIYLHIVSLGEHSHAVCWTESVFVWSMFSMLRRLTSYLSASLSLFIFFWATWYFSDKTCLLCCFLKCFLYVINTFQEFVKTMFLAG